MGPSRRLPSVLGCLLGFGFAGFGAGVVSGVAAGALLRRPALGPDPPVPDALAWDYGSVYAGSAVGMLDGGACRSPWVWGPVRKWDKFPTCRIGVAR